jgi:hypothetical protein
MAAYGRMNPLVAFFASKIEPHILPLDTPSSLRAARGPKVMLTAYALH